MSDPHLWDLGLLQLTAAVMGTWSYNYDDFNRLVSGHATARVDNGLSLGWTYDRYGNRWTQTASGSGNASAVQPNLSFTGNNNRVDGPGLGCQATQAFCYDADGNLLNDGRNTYTYDAEGRVITLNGQKTYAYDAEGRRVAKYSGSTITASYLLDLGGNQVTELNGSGAWVHSNVFAGGGALLATYEGTAGHAPNTYHYHLTDWLGTQRMQTTAAGNQEEICYSYAFGDGLSCTGADATEHHFTGKERDTESGNDYFEARYYSSTMGRFLSPDWAAKAMPVPYATFGNPQSLNLYSYMRNNPLGGADADGHWPDVIGAAITVMNYIQSHPAVAAALAKMGGSFSGKVNAGVGVEESIGKSGLKGSVAASATGFAQFSSNGVTTGSDLKLGASLQIGSFKPSIGGTSETTSIENGTELAPPGKTETSSQTGIGSFTNDEKTFSIGDETGAGPDLGAELDVDKAQFSSGLSDLGSALSNSLSDLGQTLVTAGSQLLSPTPQPIPTENPAVPPKVPGQQ